MTEPLVERIASLDDEAALWALALIVEKQGVVLGATAAELAAARVGEALSQPQMADLDTGGGGDASDGAVARATLAYLAEEAGMAGDIDQALALAPVEDERFEPVSMAVGALVLFALRSEVELRKDPERGWSFHFHHRPLKDSSLGTIFAKLLKAHMGGG